MNTIRIARNVSTAAVATIAAWSSWSHMVHVALRFGERPEVAYVLPISVDGMLIVASTAMVDDQRAGRPVRWSARVAFLAGVGASVAANIAAAQPDLGARVVAAWPAVALLLVVEILSRTRRAAGGAAPAAAAVNAEAAPDPASAAATLTLARTSSMPPRSDSPARQRQRRGRTSEAVRRMRAERPDVTLADIATQLGVTERRVRRLLGSAPTTPEQTRTSDQASGPGSRSTAATRP